MLKVLLVFVAIFISNILMAQTYAIVADRLIDGQHEHSFINPTVIVYQNKIVDINYKNRVPDSAILINLKGYTLLPGLMDVHTHLLANGEDYDKDLYSNSPSYRALRAAGYLSIALQNGITTLRDVCTEGAGFADVDLSKAIDSGFITGPRVVPSGMGIAATNMYVPSPRDQNWELILPHGTQFASGDDECLKAVREQKSRGIKWIKLFADWGVPTFNYNEIKTIVTEARKYHISVAAHATTKEGIRMSILAGVKSIEHGDAFDDSLIQLALVNHVYWSPTVSVDEYYNFPMDTIYAYLHKAYTMKIKIVMGTDVGSFPWRINETKELEYYVKKAGLTPMDAIKTATINAAELLGKQQILGQIQINFLADIIAVKGNPLEDISLIQYVGFVMKEGKIYKQPAGKQ
ncbi:MAG TPA: amidohydrolase family protein [Puia sp.]|jgi:imidazolonepropionase-like amidohydrolase|nr:amidohydrolase family protein [Puia sp.]